MTVKKKLHKKVNGKKKIQTIKRNLQIEIYIKKNVTQKLTKIQETSHRKKKKRIKKRKITKK